MLQLIYSCEPTLPIHAGSFSNGSQGGPDVAAIAVGVVLGIVLVILLIAASALIIILIVKYSSLTRKYDATGELHINAVLVTD